MFHNRITSFLLHIYFDTAFIITQIFFAPFYSWHIFFCHIVIVCNSIFYRNIFLLIFIFDFSRFYFQINSTHKRKYMKKVKKKKGKRSTIMRAQTFVLYLISICCVFFRTHFVQLKCGMQH